MKAKVAAPSKNTLVEVVVAALATTRLREVGLKALKGVLVSDPRLSILDGSVDLQPIWEVLESQPGFDAALAAPPFCYVKSLQDRLGVEVRLPGPLQNLTDADIRVRAARCRPNREEIDRILKGEPQAPRQTVTITEEIPPAVLKPTRSRAMVFGGAVAVFLASMGFLIFFVAGNITRSPDLKTIEPGEFSGDLPLSSARMWGSEVHATLGDAAWMRQPESLRRKQLELALDRLTARRLTALIVEDEQRRPRASVQLFGRPPRPFVKFY